MEAKRHRRHRFPLGELTLAIAFIMAILGLASITTSRGQWASAGAIILGLLAGLEIRWHERQARERTHTRRR